MKHKKQQTQQKNKKKPNYQSTHNIQAMKTTNSNNNLTRGHEVDTLVERRRQRRITSSERCIRNIVYIGEAIKTQNNKLNPMPMKQNNGKN